MGPIAMYLCVHKHVTVSLSALLEGYLGVCVPPLITYQVVLALQLETTAACLMRECGLLTYASVPHGGVACKGLWAVESGGIVGLHHYQIADIWNRCTYECLVQLSGALQLELMMPNTSMASMP
jgi:hypothetical protein